MCWSFFLDGWAAYLQWKQHHSALQKCILGLERVHCVGLPAKGRVLGKVRSLHPWERWIHRRNKNMAAFFLSFESYSLEWQARKAAEPGPQKQAFWREMVDGGNCGQLSPDWLDPSSQSGHTWSSFRLAVFHLPYFLPASKVEKDKHLGLGCNNIKSKNRLVGSLSLRRSFLETRMALLCQRALPGQGGSPRQFPGLFSVCYKQTDLLLSHQRPETLAFKTCWRQVTFYSWVTYKLVQNTALHWHTEALHVFSVCKHPLSTQSLWEYWAVTLAVSQPVIREPTLNQSWTNSPLASSCQ